MLKAHKIKKAIELVCANFKAAGTTGMRASAGWNSPANYGVESCWVSLGKVLKN